ncbi:MAG: hypothetical protein SNI45_06645 [Rikenellaceae bacterium]
MSKNLLFRSLVALLTIITFSRCETTTSSVEWDVAPVKVKIYLYNNSGDNLLSDSYKANLLDYTIQMTYNDTVYKLGEEVESRAYLPTFRGLQLYSGGSITEPYMSFGEFEGAKDYSASMSLYIGNGYTAEIEFVREFKWNSKGEPVGKTTFYLEGGEVDGSSIYITTTDQYADIIWDYTPVNISISVSDANGQDLLDESYEGNILSNELSLTHDGQVYYLDYEASNVATRDVWVSFNGLTYYSDGVYNLLQYGEFEGGASYDMELTLDLGTDKQYDLHYVRNFEHADQLEQPTIETQLYIDNTLIDGSIFTIEM